MDKETLSNYGWIVILVLILAVMIALATPFGSFIKSGVENTAQGLFDTEQSAFEAVGIDIADQSFEGDFDTTAPDPALNPDDGTEPQDGDTYTHGDYTYTYKASYNGWQVEVLDKTKTEYGAILESINGQPVTNMSSTFVYCESLETAPVIPNSVTSMDFTFSECYNLKTAPVIPNSVTNMTSTFLYCTSLETAPVIPNSVIQMENTFMGCISLKTAPDMSNATSVTSMGWTFYYCTALTGNIEINATPANYGSCFAYTEKPIKIVGSCGNKAALAATATNNNVTY